MFTGNGNYQYKPPVPQLQEETMLSLLQMFKEKVKNVTEPPQDRLEQFGKFVAAQIRAKHESLHDFYMKSIADVLFSDFTIDVEVDELSEYSTKPTSLIEHITSADIKVETET